MPGKLTIALLLFLGAVVPAQARLTVTDKMSTYRRATAVERQDLAARLGKGFSALSPGLDAGYFLKCLEETVNIGDPRDLEIDAAVRLCLAAHQAGGDE